MITLHNMPTPYIPLQIMGHLLGDMLTESKTLNSSLMGKVTNLKSMTTVIAFMEVAIVAG